jgi:hypothetical protein
MAKQTISIGTTANDGTGDPLRTAFIKTNENFTEVYNIAQSAFNYANTIVSDTQIDPVARQTANAAFQAANSAALVTSYTHIELTEGHEATGNIITFTRPANTNISDIIDTGLSLARANNGQGIYNSAVEGSFNRDVSPANTEWNWSGWDNLDNVHERHYRTWTEALRKKVGSNIVGAELVMHDIINDKYYKIEFTNWDLGGVDGANGAFAYTRELIDTSNEVGIVFEDGTIQTTASNTLDWPVVWLDNNNYTIRLIDAKRTLRAYDMTLSVPRDSDVNFPIGTEIGIITETVGITIERVQHIEETEAEIYGVGFGEARASWDIPARSFARLLKIGENVWYLIIAGTGADTGDITFAGDVVQGTSYSVNLSPDSDFTANNQYFRFRGGDDGRHLHFDTTDNSEFDLMIGDDSKFIQLHHEGNIVIQTVDTETDTTQTWSFGIDGSFSIPSGQPILFGNGNSRIQAGMGFHINSEEGISLEAVDVSDANNIVSYGWHFGTDGMLTFPDSTFQIGGAISIGELKTLVAAANTYAEFQTAIANVYTLT